MLIRYDGPHIRISVLLGDSTIFLHKKGKIQEYKEEIGRELLAEVRHRFVEIVSPFPEHPKEKDA